MKISCDNSKSIGEGMIKGVIFDVDGTILNSMPMWENVDEIYLHSLGVEAEPGLKEKLFTMNLTEAAEYLIARYHLNQTVEGIFAGIEEQVKEFYEERVPLKNGVREYLMEFRERKLPMMVATAGERRLVEAAFKRLGISSWFDGILTCTEMGADKRSPDVFLGAALHMDLEPSEVLVFEDAYHAIQTAKKAGFPVVAVYDKSSDKNLKKIWETADIYLPEFTDFEMFWRRVSKL